MRLTVVCAGKLKERWLREGVAEYLKRLTPYAKVDIKEIHEEKMPDDPSPAEKEQVLTREGERLLHLVPAGDYLVVLDVYGQQLSSEEIAARMADLALHGTSSITFLIGGAFGLSREVRQRADALLSLSRLTMTHQMTRLLLVEQIYRSYKINRGEKYHW